MEPIVVKTEFGGRTLTIETGKVAKQANGSVLVRYGDTVVLVTAVMSKKELEDVDFLPLTVNYQEQSYAAGKIPGGFIKREGKPSDHEVLVSRVIDRSIRPLFPDGYRYDTQIIAMVLSFDQDHDPAPLAIIGASAALYISDIPFTIPIAAAIVGRGEEGEFIINPTQEQEEKSDINITVSSSRDSIVMVEGGAQFVAEKDMLAALKAGFDAVQPVIELQEELRKLAGKEKISVEVKKLDEETVKLLREKFTEPLNQAIRIREKKARYKAIDELLESALNEFAGEDGSRALLVKEEFDELKKELVRALIKSGVRIDGRKHDEIRPVTVEVGLLPRAHGSALFTRGETQALVATTLGTHEDEQLIDSLEGESFKRFMLHYNFPPFCVGEVRPLRAPGRREIGHGALAERAIQPAIPSEEEFPYTIRVVSDIMESNGSSSMATVCGASLSLMDAGVPVKTDVAGIAMGLLKEGDEFIILSDILGDEDHLGDMDFKVAGSEEGISAIQMDIKIKGIGMDVLERALEQARQGRIHILSKMREVISKPREQLSQFAPRFYTLNINPERIKDLIGPGGKTIKRIISDTNVTIDIQEDGKVVIYAPSLSRLDEAIEKIKEVTREIEVGKIYQGVVKRIVPYGAFVEILPGVEGLLHISQLENRKVDKVEDVLHLGDVVPVKVLELDDLGRPRLSRKEALKEISGKSGEKDS